MQPEHNFNQQGEDTTPDRVLGRAGRRGRQWFSFDLPVDPAHPMTLIVTYSTHEFRERIFTVRFQPTGGNEIAAVFGLRMIRADAPLE